MASRGDVVAAALAISCIMYRHWVQYVVQYVVQGGVKIERPWRQLERPCAMRNKGFYSGSLANVASTINEIKQLPKKSKFSILFQSICMYSSKII